MNTTIIVDDLMLVDVLMFPGTRRSLRLEGKGFGTDRDTRKWSRSESLGNENIQDFLLADGVRTIS